MLAQQLAIVDAFVTKSGAHAGAQRCSWFRWPYLCENDAIPPRAKFCMACCRIRQGKKVSADLLQEFQVHAQWAASKIDVLRSRSGGGFKGKLREGQSAEEQRIYNWLYKHARDLEPASMLAQQLATVDAFVTKSEAALLQEYQVHAAPTHAASAADAAVEAGEHARACS